MDRIGRLVGREHRRKWKAVKKEVQEMEGLMIVYFSFPYMLFAV